MCDDAGTYLARQVLREQSAAAPLTEAQLLAACRQRGVAVRRLADLRDPGYRCGRRLSFIALSPQAGPSELAHELAHHILRDNAACDLWYEPPAWYPHDPETVARRFAAALCGPAGEALAEVSTCPCPKTGRR